MWKRLLSMLCVVAMFAVLLSGCSKEPLVAEPELTEEEKLYEALFDPKNKIDIKLSMEEDQIAAIHDDNEKFTKRESKSPIYRKGDLTVTITTPDQKTQTHTIEEVGVRLKGTEYSRTGFYSPERGIYNFVHLKINFQETFDDPEQYGEDVQQWDEASRKERKDRTFATLEKLDLKWNRSDDSTYIRDFYSSMLYREFGILAPRGNLFSFDWNDTHMGVYLMAETVDKVFLQRYLPESAQGGNLYKCAYLTKFNGHDSIGIEDELAGEFYQFDLKTNKKGEDHSQLTRLIAMLNFGTPTAEKLEEYVDMDYWLTLNAVAYFLGDPDDMRDDYNNIYVYFRPDTGKAIFIPHDHDRGLGVANNSNANGSTMTADNPFDTRALWTMQKQENPLFLYTICQGGYFVEEYAQKLQEVSKSKLLDVETFTKQYQLAYDLYHDQTKASVKMDNAKTLTFNLFKTSTLASQENISFKDYINAKMRNFDRYMADLDTYVNKPMTYPDPA